MEFFAEISAMTGNQPLREISERLYFQTSRIVLKLMPRLNLAEEFAAFRREMEDILGAMEIGDLESVGYISPQPHRDELQAHDALCAPAPPATARTGSRRTMKQNPIVPTVDFEKDGVQHGFLRLPWSRTSRRGAI